MLFNSWEFLALLLIAVPLYYCPGLGARKRVWQIGLLLAASAVFYAWENPKLLLLLSVSCVINAIAVERIIFWKKTGATGDVKHESGDVRAKRWLTWTVALNLGFLAFFKYAGFLTNLLPDTLLPASYKSWLSTIPLPVGISFYTFQGISMVVDVWRDDISARTREHIFPSAWRNRISSIRDTSFYISFFPQLVAGPIVKAHEFVDQIGCESFKRSRLDDGAAGTRSRILSQRSLSRTISPNKRSG